MVNTEFVHIFLNYLLTEKRRSLHTISSYGKDLDQFLQFLDGQNLSVLDCSYRNLRNWIISFDNQYSNKSIVRKIATVKSFYKFLFLRNYKEDNPALRLKNPKVPKKLPEVVSGEKLTTLLDNISEEETFENFRDKIIIELLYGTGLRREELIQLRERDIDLYKRSLSVLGKGGKERIVPFSQGLARELKLYIEKKHTLIGNFSEFLIVTNVGKKSYPSLIYRTVKKRLSLVTTQQKKSPHVLRHSYATHLLDRGADLNAIKELLGHSSLAATQVYTHNSLEKLKEVFSKAHPKA